MRRSATAGSCSPTPTSRRASAPRRLAARKEAELQGRARQHARRARVHGRRAQHRRLQRPLRGDVSGAARSCCSPGGRIRRSCAISPSTATTAKATSTRWSPRAWRACAIRPAQTFEDRTPDGRVYEVVPPPRRHGRHGDGDHRHHRAEARRGEPARGRRPSCTSRSTTCPGALAYTDDDARHRRLQRPLRRHVPGAARAPAAGPAVPGDSCATSPSTATTATATSTRWSRRRVESLRNPSGKAFEDRTPDGRVYRVAPPPRRRPAAR